MILFCSLNVWGGGGKPQNLMSTSSDSLLSQDQRFKTQRQKMMI